MAEKNIAAFLRDDVGSVSVQFWRNGNYSDNREPEMLGGKEYTYLHTIPDLKLGDHLIVMVSGVPKVVCVVRLHDGLEIQPNDNTEYKYVVCRLDYGPYQTLMKQNEAVMGQMTKAYQGHVRNQFREQILGYLPPEKRNEMLINLNQSLNQTKG